MDDVLSNGYPCRQNVKSAFGKGFAEAVEREIVEAFRTQLRKHLFSEKDMPQKVELKVQYAGTVQRVTLTFEKAGNGRMRTTYEEDERIETFHG